MQICHRYSVSWLESSDIFTFPRRGWKSWGIWRRLGLKLIRKSQSRGSPSASSGWRCPWTPSTTEHIRMNRFCIPKRNDRLAYAFHDSSHVNMSWSCVEVSMKLELCDDSSDRTRCSGSRATTAQSSTSSPRAWCFGREAWRWRTRWRSHVVVIMHAHWSHHEPSRKQLMNLPFCIVYVHQENVCK